MKIYLLGGWGTVISFTRGLKSLQSLWSWIFGPQMHWLIGVLISIIFLYSIGQLLNKNFKPLALIILIPIYVSVMKYEVPAVLPTPAMSTGLSSTINQAQQRVQSAQTALSQAQAANAGVDAASVKLAAAEGDLRRLQALNITDSGKVVAQVPVGFALPFIVTDAVALGVWHSINSVSFNSVTLQDRSVQSYLSNALAASPQLTPTEKAVADSLSKCLSAKQAYVEQSAKIAGYVRQGIDPNPNQSPPRTGKALADAWSGILQPSRTAMKQACNQMTPQLASALDASITPADVKNFEGGFQIGGESWFQTATPDKVQYLAAQMGVPASDLQGKSPDQIAKMFLRYKKLEAISKQLTSNLDQVGSGAAGAGYNAKTSFSSTAAGMLANWLGSFGLSVKPFILQALNFCVFLLPVSFFFVLLLSLWPRSFKRAWSSFLIGLIFVFSWQVTILVIEKYVAAKNQQTVAMQQPKSGFGYLGQLIDGTFQNLTGGAESGNGDAVAGAAGAAKVATSKTGIKVISKILAAGSDIALPAAVVSTLATGALSVVSAKHALDKNSQNFANLLLSDGGMDPALESLAGGLVDRQRSQIEKAQARSATIEAGLLVASPFLAMVMALGAWFLAGQAGLGAQVSQIGTGLGQTAVSSLARFTGGKL